MPATPTSTCSSKSAARAPAALSGLISGRRAGVPGATSSLRYAASLSIGLADVIDGPVFQHEEDRLPGLFEVRAIVHPFGDVGRFAPYVVVEGGVESPAVVQPWNIASSSEAKWYSR